MRIFVAGASGFVGRSVVRACSGAGHDVLGLVRSQDRFAAVRADGGTPVLGDLLDPNGLRPLVRDSDAVIHLAQASDGTLAERRRVRVQGGRNLLAAAEAACVGRCVIGSGYWVYRDNAGRVTETSPLAPMSISKVNFETERLVGSRRFRDRMEFVILRPGMIYGPGSWFAEMVAGLRSGTYAYVGDGSNYLSPVHEEDAGEAFRVAVEAAKPGEEYLVVDDAPVTTRRFCDFVAARLGVPPARGIGFGQACREWGREIAMLNRASRRASNRKLKTLGWTPRYRSFRDGVPRVLRAMTRGA